jgi:hypothetical protein
MWKFPVNSMLSALTPLGSTAETETAEMETKSMLKNFISRLPSSSNSPHPLNSFGKVVSIAIHDGKSRKKGEGSRNVARPACTALVESDFPLEVYGTQKIIMLFYLGGFRPKAILYLRPRFAKQGSISRTKVKI